MVRDFDIPAIKVAADDLMQQCERLKTAVDDRDTEALLVERMRACHLIANRLYQLLMDSNSPLPAFDYQNILDAKLPANVGTGLISLRERLDRIFHPSNFRGVSGQIVDPLTAEFVSSNRPSFREWATILRPAVNELNAVGILIDDLAAASAVKLSPKKARAFQAYTFALQANSQGATMRDLYDWLKEHGDDSYVLPGFETWERYVREGKKAADRMKADSP